MSPVDYHGWTHAPKDQGGTDPIPGLVGGSGGSCSSAMLAIPSGQTLANGALDVVTDYSRSDVVGTALSVNPTTGLITFNEEGDYDIHSLVILDDWIGFDVVEGPVLQAGNDFQDVSTFLHTHRQNANYETIQHKATAVIRDLPNSVNLQVAQFSGGPVSVVHAALTVNKLCASEGLPATPWVRRAKNASQSITDAGETTVTWDVTVNDDPTLFTTVGNTIKVLEDGLYGIFLRFYWAQWPNAHLGIVNGIDPDAFAGYPIINSNTLAQVANSVGYMEARLEANQTMTVAAHHLFGSSRSLGTGTYWEVRKLAEATTTGRDSPP